MFSWIWNELLYNPLYNLLIALIDLPYVDAGIAVVVLTLIVKFILYPLSKKAVITQERLKYMQPELTELQAKHKEDRTALAMATMELYKKHGINPFSGILTLLIQIPIIIALYYVFYKGGLPDVNLERLYSFVPTPEHVNTFFLGFLDITASKSVIIALITGLTYYIQAHITMKKPELTSKFGESMKDDMMRSMHVQMRYVLPVIITFVAFSLQAVIGLYWITSNIFSILQHLYLRRLIAQSSTK
jgi:YidC/Oxa1 family membrane protein insertase